MKKWKTITTTVLAIALVIGAAENPAAGEGWHEGGIRMGIQAGPRKEYFHLYELYAVYGLPWTWQPATEWIIASHLSTSLGALHTATDTGVIGSLGAGLKMARTAFNLVPELGVSFSLLDKRQFGRQDFGSILLWGAYIGLSYRFDNGIGIGYRILHLSNNHILYSPSTPNPGLDLHMISLSSQF